ncbi:MAG TPA: hypothetical protein PKH81_04480 [Treponemataceae bacterium]|nr:hypothetical protein [Treponemataceae bacterium]
MAFPVTRNKIPLLLVCLCALLLFACAQGSPVIKNRSIKLLRVQDPTRSFSEHLSVFVCFEDSDGEEDFSSITITHDESTLFWEITPQEAVVRLRDTERWTGSNNLSYPADGLFPPGRYTLVVADLAGNEAVESFSLSRISFPEYAPAALTIAEGTWTIERSADAAGFTRVFLYLFSQDDRLLYSYLAPDGSQTVTGTVAELLALAPGAVRVQCYIENFSGSAGVLLTAVDLQ